MRFLRMVLRYFQGGGLRFFREELRFLRERLRFFWEGLRFFREGLSKGVNPGGWG